MTPVRRILARAFVSLLFLALCGDGAGGSGGSSVPARTAVTGNTVLAGGGNIVAEITTLSADLAITLPAATTGGQTIVIRDSTGAAGTGAFFAKIVPAGSDTITDGMPTATSTTAVALTAAILDADNASLTLVSDGTSKWNPVSWTGSWGIDPRTVTGIKLWLSAQRGVVMSSRNVVSTWADYSGAGNSLANGTNAPTVVTNSTTGRPAVYFNGAQQMKKATVSSAGTTATIVVAASSVNWAIAGNVIFSLNYINTGTQGMSLQVVGTASIYSTPALGFFANGYSNSPHVGANAFSVSSMISDTGQLHVIASQFTASTGYLRVDGTDWLNASGFASANTQTGTLSLGSDAGGDGGTLWQGCIGFVVWIDGTATAAQVTGLEALARRGWFSRFQ